MLMPRIDDRTLADVLEELGGVAPQRVLAAPPLGQATIDDVVRIRNREKRLFELVDGVLIEKIMGFTESRLAIAIATALELFVRQKDLGVVSGPDGMIRFPANLVRMPDVAFVPWSEFPGGEVSSEPVPRVVPSLAVEVLSEGNTAGEMARKLREYFDAGVRLVWMVDPQTKTIDVHTSPTRFKTLGVSDSLSGGKVLPGFKLSIATIFAALKQSRRNGKQNGR